MPSGADHLPFSTPMASRCENCYLEKGKGRSCKVLVRLIQSVRHAWIV